MMYQNIIKELKKAARPAKVKILSSFFKTGKGQYGEGDKFWGIVVPEQRKIAKKYSDADFDVVHELLLSEIHEVRLTALLILVYKIKGALRLRHGGAQCDKQGIYKFYLKHLNRINNWDLVDVTCPAIVGEYLLKNKNEQKILYQLAKSKNLWTRRVAIISTLPFIRAGQFTHTLELAKKLLMDKHDLIHKAAGWMLREVGKRDKQALLKFLTAHSRQMPRVMLRYAIEKLSAAERAEYLSAGR